MKFSTKVITLTLLALLILPPFQAFAQARLESGNYVIIDSTIDSTTGISESGSYGLLTSLNPLNDSRLTSGSYAIGSGFPNGIQANVPVILCFETNTNDAGSNCNDPALTAATGGNDTIVGDGMIGVCGQPGCYDRAKIEIDHQNNPIDTLYLIALSNDNFTNNIYYLKTDKTFSTTLAFSNYMTICQLQGYDSRDTACDDSLDLGWSQSKQEFNVIGLQADTTWYVMARAISGDFTETGFSPILNATTETSTISFDIDVAATNIETNSPYQLDLGSLDLTPVTATNSIWTDVNSNAYTGVSVFIEDTNSGLFSSDNSYTILSETEDLGVSDGDGGYGPQGVSVTQTSLGPLQMDSNFSLSGNNVRGLNTTPQLLFFTNIVGNNNGPIVAGRGRISIKARGDVAIPAGSYLDRVTFTLTANW